MARKGYRLLACAAGVLLLNAGEARAQPADLEHGRALYEKHCVVCHTPKVHRRIPVLPADTAHLRFIVTVWVMHESMRWSRQDIEDVVHYLDGTYYQLN
jgi:mono/diheme cytochrome c family protein